VLSFDAARKGDFGTMPEAEKFLRVEYNIAWLPEPNEIQTVLSSQLPPQEFISTALAVAFVGDHLLMTNLISRGWDIPGGHVEPGEHPEETVRREVYEETGATLSQLHLLGYQHLRLLGPRPTAYRYPYPDCYQAFYWTKVTSLEDFLPTAETRGRALFPPAEARTLSWVQINRELYEVALLKVTG
jgi:8-oxo-dGTP pyrophosphatase MutT (NUDIX family)